MGHPVELILDGMVDFGMGVAVDIRPNRRIAIQVAAAFAVLKPSPLATNQDKWRVVLRAPIPHWREGMPKMLFIALDQCLRIPNISHRRRV